MTADGRRLLGRLRPGHESAGAKGAIAGPISLTTLGSSSWPVEAGVLEGSSRCKGEQLPAEKQDAAAPSPPPY